MSSASQQTSDSTEGQHTSCCHWKLSLWCSSKGAEANLQLTLTTGQGLAAAQPPSHSSNIPTFSVGAAASSPAAFEFRSRTTFWGICVTFLLIPSLFLQPAPTHNIRGCPQGRGGRQRALADSRVSIQAEQSIPWSTCTQPRGSLRHVRSSCTGGTG